MVRADVPIPFFTFEALYSRKHGSAHDGMMSSCDFDLGHRLHTASCREIPCRTDSSTPTEWLQWQMVFPFFRSISLNHLSKSIVVYERLFASRKGICSRRTVSGLLSSYPIWTSVKRKYTGSTAKGGCWS